MPTGYTAKLMEEGQSFEEFVLQCARAFGALIMMRDDPMDAPIPAEFPINSYYEDALRDAKGALAEAEAMTENDQLATGARLKREVLERTKAHIERELLQNRRLDEMEEKVAAWQPPTAEHLGLKEFMLQQIAASRNDIGYIERQLAMEEARSPKQFWLGHIERLRVAVPRREESLADEKRRTQGRTEWVRSLRASLKEGK